MDVGVPESTAEYDAYLARTVGSSFIGGDEIRFEGTDLSFAGARLTVPDRNVAADARGTHWPGVPRLAGRISLVSPADFNVDPADARLFRADDWLICLSDAEAEPGRGSETLSSPVRCHVARDFDLLFSGGAYRGWALLSPLRHLEGVAAVDQEPAEVVELYDEYMTVVAEPTIERMSDRDPTIKEAILSLSDRANALASASPHAARLRLRIADLIDRFY